MRQLQFLHLGDVGISTAQVAALSSALPGTTIHRC
jgi:hypothetical protein